MPKVELKSNGATVKLLTGLAGFDFSKPMMEATGKVVVQSIHRNIKNQVQGDGSPLKRNAPSTMERKRRKGRVQRSLVDQFRRFVSRAMSFSVTASKSIVTIRPTGYSGGGKVGVDKLSGYVQKMGYTGWFAIDSMGAKKIRFIVRKRIQHVLAKSRTP